MAVCDDFVLSVRIHGTDDWADPLDAGCDILVDVVERDPSLTSASEEGPDPLILEHAPAVVTKWLMGLLASDAILRVDIPRDAEISGSWPLVARTAHQAHAAIHRLTVERSNTHLYPIALWIIPVSREREAMKGIEAFRQLRMDDALFDELIALGVSRIAVFPSSITLSLTCSSLSSGVEKLRAALAGAQLEVSWDS